MSWGGFLIALAAGFASYMPHVDPHYAVIVGTIGATLAAMGESILGRQTGVSSVTVSSTKNVPPAP
jgi:membrane protein DedA with SNARE-associated domain